MDLVDIDKVLDDLELDEGEAKCPANVYNIGNSVLNVDSEVQTTSKRLQEMQVTTARGLPVAQFASAPANELNNKERSTKSKSFVNITKVFNSLQEYVDVNIEHIIRVAEHPQLPDAPQESQNNRLEQVPNQDDVKYNHEEEECTEGYPEDANGGALTSASSITTSSSSSFSSGPSPGSSSEPFGSFTPDDQPGDIAKLPNNDTETKTNCRSVSPGDTEPESRDITSDEPEPETNEDLADEESAYQHNPTVKSGDDQSAGLSSISSCWYNENTSSSFPGLSNDLCKLGALSSVPSSSPKDLEESFSANIESYSGNEMQSQQAEPTDACCQKDISVPDNKPLPPTEIRNQCEQEPEKHVVFGFGSTMDEISDTELDSILQEIDSDLQVFNKSRTNEADGENGKVDDIVENPVPIQNLPSVHETINVPVENHRESMPAKEQHSAEHELNVDDLAKVATDTEDECHDNTANMDNFSQASTIEFAESRIQADFGTDPIPPHAHVYEEIVPDEAATNISNLNQEIVETDLAAAPVAKPVHQQRPNSLDIPVQKLNVISTAGQTPPAPAVDSEQNAVSNSSSDDLSPQTYSQVAHPASNTPSFTGDSKLGKVSPFWIPDNEAPVCMQCQVKFSLFKRRHHCRACGLVLCSTCCSQKAKLEFFGDVEVRVCVQCHLILQERSVTDANDSSTDGSERRTPNRPPNPNNPMEYCSVVPPHQQVTGAAAAASPISVMVPVGVLKREGVPPKNNRKDKNVIFSDGIRPGCDLADLDNSWDDKRESISSRRSGSSSSKRLQAAAAAGLDSPPYQGGASSSRAKATTDFRPLETDSFIPEAPTALPPVYTKNLTESVITEVSNTPELILKLKAETLQFALQKNLYVFVKIIKLKCCVNKTVINFTTQGMHHVGQDEIIILLEYDSNASNAQSRLLPKDIFIHLNQIYCEAHKGRPVGELGYSVPNSQNFLDSKDHGGFLYIRPTFQCLLELHLPDAPFLIGILIHRLEIPWARVFPLRLMLRLGAQYRYYPSPHVSVSHREPVYGEIAQTIINFLADFRNYSYTLATIQGMYIHMEDRKTSMLIPKNRHEQVERALNNSSDHILALGANFSKKADGHLVCIQNLESSCAETHTYSTQAINIQGQPRKVTGASFLVLNGALKSTSGLQAKCSIVEDGLMVQILPVKMAQVRTALQNKQDIQIVCGPVDADESQTETVNIMWVDDDTEFNTDVISPIDGKQMNGIPSIRVHSGLNFANASHIIRWTEVFIIQMPDEIQSSHNNPNKDAFDVQKLSEQIAKSASTALVSFLDLLAANGCVKIGLRATLHPDNVLRLHRFLDLVSCLRKEAIAASGSNVCYETGSSNTKLPPLYMNALDNELIPTLHRQASNLTVVGSSEKPIILELIFFILNI